MFQEIKESSILEIQKSQSLRIWDVLILGPVLIYIGQKRLSGWERNFLISAGIATIIYNGRNFLQNLK